MEQIRDENHTMQYSSVQVATAQSSATHLPATSPPAVQTTVQPIERTYSSGFFYQRGKYWSTNQVKALNRNVTRDVTPSELLGRYFPTEEKDLQRMLSSLHKDSQPNKQLTRYTIQSSANSRNISSSQVTKMLPTTTLRIPCGQIIVSHKSSTPSQSS